ncbi:hypothetical protein [Streptomyces sp. NPDC052042]|uniref:hypothetical protein n=1 Tax=Streptomyces sp. NPDC052042 TaxID=3365683 RepID=UPI0037D39E6B
MTKSTNPYARAYATFVEQTTHHQLVVLHEDGLYRHLRVQAPGTRMWSWDITTWPGHLATSGDVADGYMFTRLEDMIDFFSFAGKNHGYYSDGAPSIDVRYWAEKLCGDRSTEVKKYDPDLFLPLVREHFEESEELGTEADAFRDRQLDLVKQLHKLRGLDEAASQALLDAHWKAAEMNESWSESTLTTHVRAAQANARQTLGNLWSTDGLDDGQLDVLIKNHGYHELADIDIPRQSPAERREGVLQDAEWHAGSANEARSRLSNHEDLVGSDIWEWDPRVRLPLPAHVLLHRPRRAPVPGAREEAQRERHLRLCPRRPGAEPSGPSRHRRQLPRLRRTRCRGGQRSTRGPEAHHGVASGTGRAAGDHP